MFLRFAARCRVPLPHAVILSVSWSMAMVLGSAASIAHDQVQIALVGEIEKMCALSGRTANIDLGNVMTQSRRDLTLRVSCNTPFVYSLSSANGGLRHAGQTSRIGTFVDVLPYRVQVSVPTDAGTAAFSCDSIDMQPGTMRCSPADSGGGISLGQSVALSLTWQQPKSPLLAGRFEDSLTIRFSAKP